jgi:hypothetical protein
MFFFWICHDPANNSHYMGNIRGLYKPLHT